MIYTLTLNPAIDREMKVPRIEFSEVLRAEHTNLDFGGKGLNVSRMLIELNVENTAVGFLGGKSGERVQEGLDKLGVNTKFIWVPGETRTNVSIVESGYDRYIKVNDPGPTIADKYQHDLIDLVKELTTVDDWWIMSGSVPPGITRSIYAELIRIVNAQGGYSVLDTSGDAFHLGVAAKPFLVKPNAEEAAEITGINIDSDAAAASAARKIQSLGAANVVISLGKDGALITDHSHIWKTDSLQIEEQNPVGAGDAMLAGIIWQLSAGQDARKALTWGNACGAATAAQQGTAVGPRSIVTSLISDIQIKELNDAVYR